MSRGSSNCQRERQCSREVRVLQSSVVTQGPANKEIDGWSTLKVARRSWVAHPFPIFWGKDAGFDFFFFPSTSLFWYLRSGERLNRAVLERVVRQFPVTAFIRSYASPPPSAGVIGGSPPGKSLFVVG